MLEYFKTKYTSSLISLNPPPHIPDVLCIIGTAQLRLYEYVTNIEKVNLFCILEDIQEQLLMEMKPELRHSMKFWAGKTLETSRMFIKSIDRNIKDTEGFGESADILRTKIEEMMKISQ